MPAGAGVKDGAPHAPSPRLRPLTCEESSASDYGWDATLLLLCLTASVEPYQVLAPRGVA